MASACIHRNLSTSQRAPIAAGFLAYEQAEAKKRMAAGGCDKGKENFPDPGQARDKAGERMHISGRTVDDAAKVLARAVPEIIEKVRSGDMKINEAKIIAGFNPAAQKKSQCPQDGENTSACVNLGHNDANMIVR